MNLNRVMLAGNLTRDPEGKSLNSGTFVASFGLAVNRRWKNAAGEPQEEVTFIDCEAWSKTGETIVKFFAKGKPIYVEGRLKLDQWEKDGQKFSKLRVVVESFQFVGAKGEGDGETRTSTPRTATRSTRPPEGDDDVVVPF